MGGNLGVNMDHLTALKEIQEILRSELAGYEAIGIMDGTSYFEKVESRKAIKKRLDGLIGLMETLEETNCKIKELEV